jgi:hypothetical protein
MIKLEGSNQKPGKSVKPREKIALEISEGNYGTLITILRN